MLENMLQSFIYVKKISRNIYYIKYKKHLTLTK